MYREELLDHYRKPRNSGEPDGRDNFLVEKGENQSCGDSVEVFVKVKDSGVEKVLHSTDACAVATAGVSILSVEVEDMSVEEVLALEDEWMLEKLGGEISPMRRKCALLGLRTVHKALEDAV